MDLAKDLIFAVKKRNSHDGYGSQKECEALVNHVLNNMVKSKFPELISDIKNDQDCNTFREEGNQCFVMSEDDQAIEKYTMSLAYATNKESMALAFANRSAALYRKQQHSECLIDIDSALTNGYPEEKKRKLKERAEKAIAALRQLCQIKDLNMNDLPSANVPTSSDNDSSSDEKKLTHVKEFIEYNKSESKESVEGERKESITELMARNPKIVPRYQMDENKMSLSYGLNKEAPALSKGAQIAYSEKYGRHIVAVKPFKPGDIIIIEEPFSCVIFREMYYTHCHHCLARSYNLMPCPKCPIAQYCSEKCKNEAWKMAHRIECPVQAVLARLLNLDKDKIKILTKIVRLLIIATKNGKAIDELRKDSEIAEKNSDNRTAGFTNSGIFDSHSSRSALSLATNLDSRPFKEISAFACISALSTILLATQTSFFGKKYSPDQLESIVENKDVRYCGSLIFRNCVIVSSNSFSVQQEPGVKTGSGLYVTASLMNHSCAPNTFRHFEGLSMITRALEPIKEGDQIFTSYGGGYQNLPRPARKSKMLNDYFFDCDCQACVEDWPTIPAILRHHIGSIVRTNKELFLKLNPLRHRLAVNKYDVDAVKSMIEILYTEAKMPCEEIIHATQYLKSYYLGKFQLGSM